MITKTDVKAMTTKDLKASIEGCDFDLDAIKFGCVDEAERESLLAEKALYEAELQARASV